MSEEMNNQEEDVPDENVGMLDHDYRGGHLANGSGHTLAEQVSRNRHNTRSTFICYSTLSLGACTLIEPSAHPTVRACLRKMVEPAVRVGHARVSVLEVQLPSAA